MTTDRPDIKQLYETFKAEPSQDNLSSVVHALRPTVEYNLGQQGALQDPLVRAKAFTIVADAVPKYDPSRGASLPTFVSSQLIQLGRTIRQSRSPVKIPEKIQLDAMVLNQARQKFYDQHDREPDTLELADFSGLPVKRIEHIRQHQVAVPSESDIGEQQNEQPDWDKEAAEYVYHDSDHIDRRILDMKLGYAGHPVLPPKEIALALKLTPSQLSRRSARLALRINKITNTLNRI